jgi:hypothetical protein
MGSKFLLLMLAAGLGAVAVSPASAAIPAGTWGCGVGPTWAEFKAASPTNYTPGRSLAKMWIFDASHYASSEAAFRSVYTLRGDKMIGVTGPLSRVPMSAHYVAAGLGGKPTLFFAFASAPGLALDCQQRPAEPAQ